MYNYYSVFFVEDLRAQIQFTKVNHYIHFNPHANLCPNMTTSIHSFILPQTTNYAYGRLRIQAKDL